MSDLRTSSTPPKTKIFVGRLPEEAQSHDLRRLFERFGVVTECDILNRYGFVHMKTEDMALSAIEALHNADFMGVQISVEQSTGKKSGRGVGPIRGGGGGGGFVRGRGRGVYPGGMGRSSGPPPYMRPENGRGDYGERRPGPPPPPAMRNGYYDSYDRSGYDSYYASRGPPPPMPSRERFSEEVRGMGMSREPERRSYSELMRSPYERRSFSEAGGRSPYDRALPPAPAFERRAEYAPSRAPVEAYRRRSPPPPSYNGGGYASSRYEREPLDRMDPYGPPARRYPTSSSLDRGRDLLPPRRF